MGPKRMLSIHGALLVYVGFAPSSAAYLSLRPVDGAAAGEADQNAVAVDTSVWPFHGGGDDIERGITFERTETSCPLLPVAVGEGAAGERLPSPSRLSLRRLTSSMGHLLRSSLLELSSTGFLSVSQSPSAVFDDGHCKSFDEFGGNVCHYSWGDDMTVTYDARLGDQELDQDVYIEMSVKIDSLIHHTQTCPVCGNDPCAIVIPALPKAKWTIELPKCPITPHMMAGEWVTKLPNKNPIPTLLNGSSGTVVEATVWLKKRIGESDDGDVLMKVKGNGHLK